MSRRQPRRPRMSSPAAAFVQACAATPAISLRMLPQVGEAIARHYSPHPQFLWSDQGSINAKAQAAIATLAASDTVGLDPADYRVAMPDLKSADRRRRAAPRCCASSSRFRRKS